MTELYWNGGPFQPRIDFSNHMFGENIEDVIAAFNTVQEFVSATHKNYIAFFTAMHGMQLFLQQYGNIFVPEHANNTFFIGSGPPDTPQSPGVSTIGQIPQGDLMDSLASGGTFEDYHAKAFLVTIYHLWDEYFRPRLANELSVKSNQVICALMGDLRQVRNWIIHEQSMVPADYSAKLPFINQVWPIEPGHFLITSKMINSLMEQANSLRVVVVPEPM